MAAAVRTKGGPRAGKAARPKAYIDPAQRLVREFITPEGVDLRLQLGTVGERAAAFVIDFVIIQLATVLLFLAALAAALGLGFKGAGTEIAAVVWIAGAFFLRDFYFIAFELTPRAATPGKRALGLRVAARDGGRLTSEAIFTRNAMREIEIFLPLLFLIGSAAGGEAVESWMALLGVLWTGIFLLFPLFNRDKLRVGDLLAGTWVVKAPRRTLAIDLAHDAPERLARFAFTPEQAAAYGVKELQVLEDVLRRRDPRTLKAVADRIRTKIAWAAGPGEHDADFLSAYYAALRGRLENRLLFGHRRKDKFDKA